MALHITSMRANYLPVRTATAKPVRQSTTTANSRTVTQQGSSSTAASAATSTSFRTLLGDTSASATAATSTATTTSTAASTAPTAKAASADSVPTPESAFGDNPWLATPFGSGPNGFYYYNNIYFASPTTAAKVAQMVGGTVVQKNMFSVDNSANPYQQQQANAMVQMPNGALINAGLVASFYTHGYSQSTIDRMIAQEVANTPPPTTVG